MKVPHEEDQGLTGQEECLTQADLRTFLDPGPPAGSGEPLVSEENPGQAVLRKRPHVSDRENVLQPLKAS